MFKLPALPYSKTSLKPFLTEEQIRLHHEKHHQAYIDKLNQLAETVELRGSLEEITLTATGAVFNNAAQAWNHTFFWQSMAPLHQGGEISTALSEAVVRDFGNLQALQTKFVAAGLEHFGSGWVWLCTQQSGRLSILTTPNAAVPFNDGVTFPLLVADLWEHAYYVDYKNDRKKYLENFWGFINWKFVSENFDSKKVRNLTNLMS